MCIEMQMNDYNRLEVKATTIFSATQRSNDDGRRDRAFLTKDDVFLLLVSFFHVSGLPRLVLCPP